MLTAEPGDSLLGATAGRLDLRQSIAPADFGRILLALGTHGVLRFPDQLLEPVHVKQFSELFGEIQGSPIRAVEASRPMRRCQVMATKVFDPAFLRPAYEAATQTDQRVA